MRCAVLAIVLAGTLLLVFLLPPMPQDPSYHAFADDRTFLGVPSFFDVVTNFPFLLLGLLGLRHCQSHGQKLAPRAWTVFFAATFLVGLGSAWYHLAPSNGTLIWDRLPMAAGFMGLFVALLAEHIDPRADRHLLWPAVMAGVASVAWWALRDDLRLYGWVQVAPLLTAPLVLLLFRGAYTHRAYLLGGLGCYLAAKVAEVQDAALFRATGEAISGHSLKHLLAALAVLSIYLMIRRRRLRTLG